MLPIYVCTSKMNQGFETSNRKRDRLDPGKHAKEKQELTAANHAMPHGKYQRSSFDMRKWHHQLNRSCANVNA